MVKVRVKIKKPRVGLFGWLWKFTKFCIFYIILGPITLLFYIIKWIFKS